MNNKNQNIEHAGNIEDTERIDSNRKRGHYIKVRLFAGGDPIDVWCNDDEVDNE